MDNVDEYSEVTLRDIKKSLLINAFVKFSDDYLASLSFTEHGMRHVNLVAFIAMNVLLYLGYSKRISEVAGIAGYMHDIGNIVNRQGHGQSSALLSMRLLKDMEMTPKEIALIISAIGNHEIGEPVNPVSAALILADKSDVHKSRVRSIDFNEFNIHERVNFAVEKSFLKIAKNKKVISLQITIDTRVSKVMEFFEIFMSRMLMCRKAARALGCVFELIINSKKLV
jgi:metal-dependent HD superfamily phosphatase/phosphodiesterase